MTLQRRICAEWKHQLSSIDMSGEGYGPFDRPKNNDVDYPAGEDAVDQPYELEPEVQYPEDQPPESRSDMPRFDVKMIIPAALGEAEADRPYTVETTADDPADRLPGDFITAQHLVASIVADTAEGSVEERLHLLPDETQGAIKAFMEYGRITDMATFANLTQEEAQELGHRIARQASLDIYPVVRETALYIRPLTTPELLDLPLKEHWEG